MQQVLASSLPDKRVISADGRRLGTVYNFSMNLETGTIESLLIDSERSAADFAEIERTGEGRFRVPAALITGIDDQVVVNVAEA